jgi:hypothetical protein
MKQSAFRFFELNAIATESIVNTCHRNTLFPVLVVRLPRVSDRLKCFLKVISLRVQFAWIMYFQLVSLIKRV